MLHIYFAICTIWMLTEIIVLLILSMFDLDDSLLQNSGSFISEMCMLLLVVIIKHIFNHNQYPELSLHFFFAMLSIPLSCIYIMHHLFIITQRNTEYVPFSVTASFLLLLVNYLMFEIYDKICKVAELREINKLYEQQLELCGKQAEEREKSYFEIQKTKHDLNKHFSALLGMSQKGQLDDIKNYINEVLNDGISLASKGISNSGNIIVDSLINYEYAIATKEKINFSADIFIPPHLPFHDGHITIILGNLLENAIEACRNVVYTNRFIFVNIVYSKEILQISIKNSNIDKEKHFQINKNIFTSTNNINTNHQGIGLLSVKQAAQNYHGQLKIIESQSTFQAILILYGEEC